MIQFKENGRVVAVVDEVVAARWKAEEWLRKRHGEIDLPNVGKGLKTYLSNANRADDFRRLKEML